MVERTQVVVQGARLGSPWPSSAIWERRGLEVAGVAAVDLAQRFGTPVLVFDEDEIRERCRSMRARFPRVLYAVKAFTAHAMIRIASEEGLDLLASSGGEVEACLRAGVPASRVVLHGNNKSDDELALAIRAGLSLVVVDHADELARLHALARKHDRVQPIVLRVVPEVHVQTHEAIATGHDASKFGTTLTEAVEIVRTASSLDGVRFEGLHAHIGSQVIDPVPYLRSIDALVGLATRLRDELGASVGTLDVGGGFGVRYVDEDPLADDALAVAVVEHLAQRCAEAGLDVPSLIVEPGRSLVANAGFTLYRIGVRKQVGGSTADVGASRTLLAVDGGMSDNLRPMLYDARHTVSLASPSHVGSSASAFTIVGKHCESGDTLAEDVELPGSTGVGDLLAFAATGAYTYSLANNYNQVGRPAVVGVRGGHAHLWLRREDDADLERLEAGALRMPDRVELTSGIMIRPATPRDVHSYLMFWSEVVAEAGYVRSERVAHPARVYRRRFRRPWTDREAQIVAVDDNDRVVGHVYVQREADPVTSHVATLGIAVAADHRGHGVGSALLAEAIRWACSIGVEKIVLSVYPKNTGAIALYRKFGFVQEGRLGGRSRKSTGYEDEILMGAWIDPNVDSPGTRTDG